MAVMGEYHRFSKGIFAWIGFHVRYVPYEAEARASGQSKWSFGKLLRYAFDGILSFSTAPLHAATGLGAVSALAAFVYLIVVVVQKLTCGIAVPGYATIVVLLLFLGGLQLVGLGIIGEYVGKIYLESKRRPIYIARTVLSNEDENGKIQEIHGHAAARGRGEGRDASSQDQRHLRGHRAAARAHGFLLLLSPSAR